jgi:hypothetical protein
MDFLHSTSSMVLCVPPAIFSADVTAIALASATSASCDPEVSCAERSQVQGKQAYFDFTSLLWNSCKDKEVIPK